MGQQEVLEFLESRPNEWFTLKQISEQSKIVMGAISTPCRKLHRTGFILRKILIEKGKNNTFLYRAKDE